VGSARSGANTMCLEHPCLSRFVSRCHAEFGPSDDGHYVADKGSTNGTWVNGRRLRPHVKRTLVVGDILTFGEPNVLVQFTQTPNCYAYIYQEKLQENPRAASSRVGRRDPEMFERHGKHDFGRPMSAYVAQKLSDKGIYKIHLDDRRPTIS